jgi:DNA repair and recombination protein RAD54 and RAD54-like protein
LTTIALLHTLLNHPGLIDKKYGCGLVRTALLVVPVNTEASWQTEFKKWTNGLQPSMLIWVLSEMRPDARSSAIDQWISRGGVLIVSKDSFARAANINPVLQSRTDLVVVDEAHLALSNRSNQLYKALDCIETKRRILLTGSPFQNNG